MVIDRAQIRCMQIHKGYRDLSVFFSPQISSRIHFLPDRHRLVRTVDTGALQVVFERQQTNMSEKATEQHEVVEHAAPTALDDVRNHHIPQ